MSVTTQDLVLDRNSFNRAYLRVKRNKGAASIDDMTVNDLLPYLRENRTESIASLCEGKYKPAPVEWVETPKSNGGVRKLGIPTMVDRMVQQAVAQILTPTFEHVFSDNSFGFRPHRGAHDATAKVVDFYNQSYRRVVDLDLKAYFDNVNRDLMVKYLQQYVDDLWTLRLTHKLLTSGVLDHGLFVKSEKGTPRGGPLSPILANIYLNELDKELVRRGHRSVRYADNYNIYVKSQRVGERVVRNITQFLEKQLKVKMNPDRIKVGGPLQLKFLGSLSDVDHSGTYARPTKQSQQRVKKALRLLTKRNRGISLTRMSEETHRKMRGWLQYYLIGKLTDFIQRLDKWLGVRMRQYIWKQWKRLKTKVTNLQKPGLPQHDAYVFASTCKGYWRAAHSKTLSYSLTNRKLE